MKVVFNPFTNKLEIIPNLVGGSNKQIQFNDNGVLGGAELYYDKVNKRLGIGKTTPAEKLDVDGYVLASGFKSGALTKSTFATGLSTPACLAFDTSGNLYVSNYGGTTVDKITPGGTKSTFASGLSGPLGLAFDASGNLYVSNYGGTTVDKITPGGTKSTFATGLSGPYDLIFDTSGNLYVSNSSGTTVDKITPGGTKSTFASGLSGPLGLAFDTSGNLYVSNYGGTTVDKITPGGSKSTFATGLSGPYDLIFDTSGNLYVSNGSGTTIDKITPGGVKSTFVTGLTTPRKLAFDTSGNLYVSNYGGTTVEKITPGGVKSTFVSGLSGPFDLVFDTSANLYISNRGGTTVEKITMGSSNSFLKGDGTTDATIYLSGAGVLGRIPFYSGANTLTSNSGLFWDNVNSRLGLGTTTPSEKLHVVGNGIFTGTLKVGAYTLPSTDGTANQVLKTNGSGGLTWQNDNSNVKRYIRVNTTTNGSNYAMDGTKEVVLIDYRDPCEVTLPTVDGLPDGSVFEIQYYNWDISSISIHVYSEGSNSEGIDDGYGISSVASRIKLESNPQANTTTPLSLRIMWLASDNVWTVLQGGVFNY